MTISEVIKKIDRYLKKDNVGSLVVDVQNKTDMEAIVTQYQLPQNIFICASDPEICNSDEFPAIDKLLAKLATGNDNFFVREVSTFFMLKGEKELSQELKELLSMSIAGHVVILTYQCKDYLQALIKNDKRLEGRICILDGDQGLRPKLVFTISGVKTMGNHRTVNGLRNLAKAIESEMAETLYVETKKLKASFPFTLYSISEKQSPYDILCDMDDLTSELDRSIGTEEDWKYALTEFQTFSSWDQLISAKIGNIQNLDLVISNYSLNSANKRWLWLYFIGLKLFGAANDWCMNKAISKANSPTEFVRCIYRCILEVDPKDTSFDAVYERRRALLNALGNPIDEAIDFCKIVLSKERYAICYLTDNTVQEKELLFKLLDKYGLDYEKTELLSILKRVYPALYAYLQPYRFKNDLLDGYFQEYKYQKVINKIFPEFMALVEQQAVSRDYNAILQPRSALVEGIDKANAQTYFTDAMGVEYLGYIMARCQELQLMAKVSVCRSELPSITSRNKEFWEELSDARYPIITVDKIDKIKHHGEEGYDYSREDKKLPIHLIRELEIIDDLLKKIKVNLASGNYGKAILISDHGASRLAVIHETENLWEMESAGKHSGRCCPKSEIDVRPDSAADADDFWALANYDRFKGSRKANVEVHGGATLEEVVVPIIEITYLSSSIEVKLMPIDAAATFTGTPEIIVSFRKKAAIKIFATQKLMDVSIEIDGHTYDAEPIDENFYVVKEMPEIRRAKKYTVNVFACGNKIADSLPLIVKKESGSEKSIL